MPPLQRLAETTDWRAARLTQRLHLDDTSPAPKHPATSPPAASSRSLPIGAPPGSAHRR